MIHDKDILYNTIPPESPRFIYIICMAAIIIPSTLDTPNIGYRTLDECLLNYYQYLLSPLLLWYTLCILFPVGYLTFIEVLLYMFHLWGQALAYSLYWHCYCLNGERGGELMFMYTFRSVYSVVWTYRAK